MALLKFKYGPSANLANKEIENGVVYITNDSQEMKVDIGGKRLTISDFVTVTAAELDTVAISENLFYYVSDTKTIVKYAGVDAEGKRIWEGINNTDQIAGMNTRLLTAEGEIDALQTADEAINERIDGLNATHIETTDDIVVTTKVGNYNVGEPIPKDTDLQTLILNMLCEDSAPSVTQPGLSFTGGKGITYVEVGSSKSVTVSTSYTNGSYPYGYALDGEGKADLTGSDKDKATAVSSGTGTGVTLTKMAINYGGAEVDSTTSSTLSVSVDSGIKTTATSSNVTATATHSAGNVPVSILKNKYPSKKIAGNTITTPINNTNNFPSFRWYEPVFSGFKYEGALIADPEAITAAEIKALGVTVKDANAYSKTPVTNAKATGSWRQYFIAVPVNYGKELTKIVDTTNQPLAFKKKASNVSVTLGTATVEYEVFYVSFPSAFDTVEFNLTW
jgi:hypothetical protein